MVANTLSLFLPGLLRMPAQNASRLHAPALSRLLARSQVAGPVAEGLRAELAAAAGWDPVVASCLPLAAAAAQAWGLASESDTYWLFADPVHLQTDMHRVLLLPPEQLTIDAGEVEALAGTVREVVVDAGAEVVVAGGRVLIRGLPASAVELADIDRVAGRDILAFMPGGAGAAAVRALLNAIQMSLHEAACNQARAERGLAEVNALWLWGGGSLAQMPQVTMPTVWADAAWAAGLAQHTGAVAAPLPERLVPNEGDGALMVVIESAGRAAAAGDIAAWRSAVEQIDEQWIAPALRGLVRGRWGALRLVAGGGLAYTLTPFAARRFWRRGRAIAEYLV